MNAATVLILMTCLFLFFGYMLLGAVWFAVLKRKSPQTLAAIEHDMEG